MRIALGVEYNGATFCGWQTQRSGRAVQDALERALGEIAGEPIKTVCAGRTDSGVHALEQVVHFDTTVQRPQSAWVRGVNNLLPPGAVVLWMVPVPDNFNARFAACERHYRYVLLNHPVRPAVDAQRVSWFHHPLDIERMCAAAGHLLGPHDFSAFRAAECQAKSPVRELRRLDIEKRGDYILFDFAANGFLHHMVRNLVGTLVLVGKGGRGPEWVADVLASRDRTRAAPTMDASGLYLVHVSYDEQWALPRTARSSWFHQ